MAMVMGISYRQPFGHFNGGVYALIVSFTFFVQSNSVLFWPKATTVRVSNSPAIIFFVFLVCRKVVKTFRFMLITMNEAAQQLLAPIDQLGAYSPFYIEGFFCFDNSFNHQKTLVEKMFVFAATLHQRWLQRNNAI